MIEKSEWKWFGHAAHLVVGQDCRFHLATLIGEYLISTVGEYLPDSSVREVLAESRGIHLEGRGDDRQASWMEKVGFEDIGLGRKYETMVFHVSGFCERPDCGCGRPEVDSWGELDSDAYNNAGSATRGHYAMCEKVASGKLSFNRLRESGWS